MFRKILITVSLLTVLITPSLSARAFYPSEKPDEFLNNLKDSCQLSDEKKAIFKDELSRVRDKSGKVNESLVHEIAVKLGQECANKELSLREDEQSYDYDRLKRYLTQMQDFRNTSGSSTQFLYYPGGLMAMQIILYLNTFITPDNWLNMQDWSGRIDNTDELSEQIKTAFVGNPNNRSRIASVDPAISSIMSIFFQLLIVIISIIILLSVFEKDKTGSLFKRLSKVGLKVGWLYMIPTAFALAVVAINFGSLLVTSVIPLSDECNEKRGIPCLVEQSTKDLVYADFYKLKPEQFEKDKPNLWSMAWSMTPVARVTNFAGDAIKSVGDAVQGKKEDKDIAKDMFADAVGMGWGVVYFILFFVIAGSALYFGCMFMTVQVHIFIKFGCLLFATYLNAFNISRDIGEDLKKLFELIVSSIANIAGFSFVLFVCFLFLKGGFAIWKITLVVTILLGANAFFTYFYVILGLGKMQNTAKAFEYKEGVKAGYGKIQQVKQEAGKKIETAKGLLNTLTKRKIIK